MGLGEAIARMFAHESATVICVDLNSERNEIVVQSIVASGGKAVSLIGDVATASDVERVGHEIDRHVSHIDILVNNAGVISSRETVVDLAEANWDESLRVNVKSVFLMSRMVVPRMLKHGGSIINMSSITGVVGLPVRPAYSASKAAVASLARQMAVDFGGYNIRVNAIAPSFVITDINRAMFRKMQEEKIPWEKVLEQHPLGKLGEPDDVAYAAVYLASDESRWVTGINLPVDGGYTAR